MAQQKCLIIYLVASNVLFLIAGVFMLVLDIKEFASPTSDSHIFKGSTTASRSNFQSALSVLLSLIKVIMAVFGLSGVFTKSRLILTGFTSLLTVDIVMRVIMLVMTIMACVKASTFTGEAIQNVFHLYGNYSYSQSADFTKAVDDFSTKVSCCGWSLDDKQNLYLETAWYKQQFAEATDLGPSPQTLPKYCCVGAEALDKCVRTKDFKAAREAGLVHKSCLHIATAYLRFGMYAAIVAHSLLLLLNIVSMFAALMLMKDIARKQNEMDRRGSPDDP